MIESPSSSKYQYSVAPVTGVHAVPGRFDAVKVDNMLEQPRSDLLLEKKLRLLTSTMATVAPVRKGMRTLVSRKPSGIPSPVG